MYSFVLWISRRWIHFWIFIMWLRSWSHYHHRFLHEQITEIYNSSVKLNVINMHEFATWIGLNLFLLNVYMFYIEMHEPVIWMCIVMCIRMSYEYGWRSHLSTKFVGEAEYNEYTWVSNINTMFEHITWTFTSIIKLNTIYCRNDSMIRIFIYFCIIL